MQKIFTKYLCAVMSAALLVVLLLNYFLQSNNAQMRMVENARMKLHQVSQTLLNNDIELKNLTASLEEDYLTRARAFQYIIEQNPSALSSQSELERIKELLNVDELHVINGKGILFAGTVPKYFGMNFQDTKQTAEFLPLLNQPYTSYLVQEIQPNGAEQKVCQYVAVPRKDVPGIVQVGLAPNRLLDAQKRNELDYIFSRLPADAGSSIFAIDTKTGAILADTDPLLVGKDASELGFTGDYFAKFQNGGFQSHEGDKSYYYMEKHGSLILGISQKEGYLYEDRLNQMVLISICLVLTFLIVIWAIHLLLEKQIVRGIHNIMVGLSKITDGKLDTIVAVESNSEFKQLSLGINKMVKSLLEATVKISRIIELVDAPIAIFEFHEDSPNVMASNRLKQILLLSEEEADRLYEDKNLFVDWIYENLEKTDEYDLYKINSETEKWVKMHQYSDTTGTFGVVTDMTQDMIEKLKIKHERDYDPLTGLCNLSKFKQLVRELMEKPEGVAAMLMLDLDYFKSVNDQYGHDWGDSYLRITARFLKGISPQKSVVARRSGDEFCMFLYGFSEQNEILTLLDRFYERVQKNCIIFPDGKQACLQISIGISWFGSELNNYDELIHAADIALYDAKNNEKGACRQFSSLAEQNKASIR